MIKVCGFIVTMASLSPAVAAPVFSMTGEQGAQTLTAQTKSGTTTHRIGEDLGSLEAEADFDGDGHPDALISTNCGGNGCPESTFAFASVKDGKLRIHQIDDALEARVVEARGTRFVELRQAKATLSYVFTGTKSALYSTRKHLVLHPTVAVNGLTPGAKAGTRRLKTDVDLDGKLETIQCEIWERWGSLLCTLPTPTGPQKLSTGCDRFGALPTTANGRREFVCNTNSVIRFDGKKWLEPVSADSSP